MKDANQFDKIDVAMDVVKYVGPAEDYRGRYLVLEKGLEYRENRDRYNPEKGGVPWEIPGGKFEVEMDSYPGLVRKQEGMRELWEETEIPAVPLRTGDLYPGEQEDVDITFYPVYFEYFGDPGAVELDPEEHESYEWIDEEEFRERMTPNEIEALNRVD